MRIILLYDNLEFAPEIKYAFCVLFSILGLDFTIGPSDRYTSLASGSTDNLFIYYGDGYIPNLSSRIIQINPSRFFGSQYLLPASLPTTPISRTRDGLPVIFLDKSRREDVLVEKLPDSVKTNADIVASTFFLVTQYEEALSTEKDLHDRFPASASLAYREHFLDRPLVNEYAELLWSWISHLFEGLPRRTVWGARDYAFCLTHDIDHLRKKFDNRQDIRRVIQILTHGHPRYGAQQTLALVKRILSRNPYDTFQYLLNAARENAIHSTFYFLAEPQADNYEGGYKLDDPRLSAILKAVSRSGCEIGLHTGYHSYKDQAALRREKNQIIQQMEQIGLNPTGALGCRQHFLRWQTPMSWTARDQAGFVYDSSVGFAAHPGFRSGICLPFRPYDIKSRQLLDLWEVPLVVMDGSLADQNYLNLTPAEGEQMIFSLLEIVRKYQGVFTLLWHNSFLDEQEAPGWREVLARVMREVSQQNILRETVFKTVETFQSFGDMAYQKHSSLL